MPLLRFLQSIAAQDWNYAAGDVVDVPDDSPHVAFGDNIRAEIIDPAVLTVTAPPPPSEPSDAYRILMAEQEARLANMPGYDPDAAAEVARERAEAAQLAYDEATKAQLQAELAARELPVSGNKDELVERLENHDAATAATD